MASGVVLRARPRLPARAEAAGQPAGKAGAGPEDEEESGGDAGKLFGNVVEDVVAALVAEDEEDFVVGQAVGGCVPKDKALGRADAGDVGVEAVGFGLAFIRNIRLGAMLVPVRATTASSRADERGMVLASGSNLLKMGSSSGAAKAAKTISGSETSQMLSQ